MKILALSDEVVPFIYSPAVRERFGDVGLIVGCGDLPVAYLEYVVTQLNVPLVYVPGNHDPDEYVVQGGLSIDGRWTKVNGVSVGGLGGSQRYKPVGKHQYTDQEMLGRAAHLLLTSRMAGRHIDVFVAHSAPLGIRRRPRSRSHRLPRVPHVLAHRKAAPDAARAHPRPAQPGHHDYLRAPDPGDQRVSLSLGGVAVNHVPSMNSMSDADFRGARIRAFFLRVLGALSGHSRDLLAFESVRENLHLGGPVYRGVQTVRIDQIIGSVDRYRDFDRIFLPTQFAGRPNAGSASTAPWYQEVSLPPVLLYQVGDVYFVVDGNHRVSVGAQPRAGVHRCRGA